MEIILFVFAYILIGFLVMLVWAKIDSGAADCAKETWWLAVGIVLWPWLLLYGAAIAIFYPLKLLLNKLI